MGEGVNRSSYHAGRSRLPLLAAGSVVMLTLGLFPGWSRPAQALTLISIRDLYQSAGLSYTFLQSTLSAGDERSTESEQGFTEDYGIDFQYSLLSPQLLKGNAMLNLEWNQQSAETDDDEKSRSKFRLLYNITGQLLSKKPYPVTIIATSSSDTISQSFAPSYDSALDGLTARLAIVNNFVPSSITIDRQTLDTSGFNQNFTQTTNSFSIDANPKFGRFGAFTLGATKTDSASTDLDRNQTTNHATATARAGGQRGWQSARGLSRAVSLLYSYHANEGTTSLKNQSVTGHLHWSFGKALDGSAQYLGSTSRSPLFTAQNQSGALTLTHRLFASLTTSLSLSAAKNSYNDGDTRSTGGTAGFAYHKELAGFSAYNFGYNFGYSLNERTGTVTQVNVLNEQHPIPPTPPRRITLVQPTFQADSIQVVGAQTLLPYPASFFTIVPEGIELTDFFAGDTAVLVSYIFQQDPSVTTSSLSHGIATSLGLFQGKYLLYGNARLKDQNLEEGSATQLTLTNTRHYDAGFTASITRHTFTAEAGYDKSYVQDLYYLTTSWGYATPFARGDLSINASDRYTWQSKSQNSSQVELWTNSFNVRSEYRRAISFLTGRLKLDYANSMTNGENMVHATVFGMNIEGRFGKLAALLTSSLSWTFSGAGTSSSQGVGVSIRRSF